MMKSIEIIMNDEIIDSRGKPLLTVLIDGISKEEAIQILAGLVRVMAEGSTEMIRSCE